MEQIEIVRAALEDLRQMPMDAFWELESGVQNQVLHALFGNVRLVVLDGAIIGLGYYKRKKMGPRTKNQ